MYIKNYVNKIKVCQFIFSNPFQTQVYLWLLEQYFGNTLLTEGTLFLELSIVYNGTPELELFHLSSHV